MSVELKIVILVLVALGVQGDAAPASAPTAAQLQTNATLVGLLQGPELGALAANDVAAEPQSSASELSLAPLNPKQIALRDRVRRTLAYQYQRHLNTRDHNPWEMMHAIIAYGQSTAIRRGQAEGPKIDAVKYLAGNGACHGLTLLFIDRGRVNARKGPYVQGHYAQLLAILAQSRVPLDVPLTVEKKTFKLGDLLETEKWTCDTGMELTFKLISFTHYCDTDMTWKNFKGETWDIPRLIKEELAAPILSNAACGGTHRLTALAYAVQNRTRQGKPITGQWLRAQKYLDDYHRYTLALQNSDGSFSTEWFRRREAKPDLDRRLQTTGHILEWLVYSVPQDQLDHPQVVKAVNYLSSILLAEPGRKWEIGPLGHAIHALALYDGRRYRPLDAPLEVARRPNAGPSKLKQLLGIPEKDEATSAPPAVQGSVVKRPAFQPQVRTRVPGTKAPSRFAERNPLQRKDPRQPQAVQPKAPAAPRPGLRQMMRSPLFDSPSNRPTVAPAETPSPEAIQAPQVTIEEVAPQAKLDQTTANAPSSRRQPMLNRAPSIMRSEDRTPPAPALEDGPSLTFPQ